MGSTCSSQVSALGWLGSLMACLSSASKNSPWAGARKCARPSWGHRGCWCGRSRLLQSHRWGRCRRGVVVAIVLRVINGMVGRGATRWQNHIPGGVGRARAKRGLLCLQWWRQERGVRSSYVGRCRRVSKSRKQYYLLNLKRVLQYIQGYMDLKYTTGADDLVDVFELGLTHHLNMKSSTKPNLLELLTTYYLAPYGSRTSWGNKGSIKLMRMFRNRIMSVPSSLRRMAACLPDLSPSRFFCMKDRITSKGIMIQHCPRL